MKFLYKLEPKHDRTKSFYNKAKVYADDQGHIILMSYNTAVAVITDKMATQSHKTECQVKGWYSMTTSRHINEFLLQYNITDRALSKKQLEEGCVIYQD